jgi:hypothetical protein
MIEKAEVQQPEEEVQIEISDEPEQQAQSEDELTEYSKRVSRRVNKLNQKAKEAEERAQAAIMIAQQKEQELAHYRQLSTQQQTTTLQAEEEKVKAQEAQVDDIYRQAVKSGDADLMSQATTLKNEIAIKKEKIKTARLRQEQQSQQNQQYQQYQQYQQAAPQQEVKPTDQALSWHERNKWYGDAENEDNMQATQFAYFTHFNLINEGYEPDSDEYYEALDSRIRRAYPDLSGGQEAPAAAQSESRPAVQRVASATPSGRQQSRGKQSGVRFSNSELERIRGLKPHNMSDDQWLKTVAREKQKIQQRGAR